MWIQASVGLKNIANNFNTRTTCSFEMLGRSGIEKALRVLPVDSERLNLPKRNI